MISPLILMAALMNGPADDPAHHGVRPLAKIHLAQAATSPDDAAAMARAQTGGRVLGVDWGERGGQPVYLVRVLMPDGNIRVVPIAASGR